jgi:hypothetical protein
VGAACKRADLSRPRPAFQILAGHGRVHGHSRSALCLAVHGQSLRVSIVASVDQVTAIHVNSRRT